MFYAIQEAINEMVDLIAPQEPKWITVVGIGHTGLEAWWIPNVTSIP